MSSPTVVDVVISGTTATVVDTRVDGITTVEGTPQVTNVSGQIPDLGVTTNYLAGQGEILSLINDVANLRANVIITGQTLTDEIGVLSGVLISTGNYLESNILTLSGNLIASGNNLDSLRDILSGNLITTGQTLQTQITNNDADIAALLTNLITTGQTLQTQITSNDGDIATLTSNLATTGQTLTTDINTVSTNLISTGEVVDGISGNLITTGQTLQTQITSNDGDITTLTSDLSTLTSNVVTTGQTLQTQITSNDSDIATLDSTTVKLTTNQSIAGNKIFSDRVTINNLHVTGTEVIVDVENLAVKDNLIHINSGESGAGISRISGGITIDRGTEVSANLLYNDATDRFEFNFPLALQGNLAVTANQTGVYASAANLITTGQTLQTQITSNDGDISTLTTTLATTGATLTSEVGIVSGLITNNDGDITALKTATGVLKTSTDANTSNLITTGNFLTSEINIVSGLAGGSVINELSGNLITTGQTLQVQITSNDSNISTITSNLVTTGQTLTDEKFDKGGGTVSGNILPDITETLDLGSSTKKWDNLWAKDAHIDSGTLFLGEAGANIKVVDNRIQLEGDSATKGPQFQGDVVINDGTLTVSGNLAVTANQTGVLATSANLITTGGNLETQIASNDIDISHLTSNLITTGQTLTSEIIIVSGLTTGSASDPALSGKVDTLSGNLITTGQHLTDEIIIVSGIAGGQDFTTLSGNLITTGQTLTTDINAVSSNLVTTGQTLQTQITSNDSDISNLTSNVITTGQTLTSEIAIVSGIAESHTDVTALSGKVDDISGNLITTGQTLQTQITSNDGDITTLTSNLITTGQTLTSEIAIVSGIATGGSAEDFAALSGDLITTGQTLQTQITSNDSDISTLTSNLISTGAVVDDISGNLITTGQTLQTQITSNDSDISTLTSNLISTGSVVDDVSGNLIATGQTLTTSINTNSSNLITTGQTLTSEIAIVSGIAEAHTDVSALSGKVDDISGNLITTGQTLTTNINTVSTNLITTGQTLTTSIDTVSSNLVSTGAIVDDVSGNLITTGQTLQTQITSNDGDITNLTSNLITTGQTLTSEIGTVSGLITDNDAEITALLAATGELKTDTNTNASNLVITGQTLTSEIAIVSGIAEAHTDVSALSGKVDDISGNLITTGQTLQTQITSNDTDISNLTANLISTGSIVDDISGNLITTGQTLQTQITSNDGDITNLTSNLITTGQTLTTEITTVSGLITDNDGDITALKAATGVLKTSTDDNTANLISTGAIVDDISGNLITSGQTLQTQITSNDSDISTLTSNVITTGQTLTTDIDSKINTVTANLITTGQTLTSELAIVSGIATGGSAEEFADLSGNLITTGQTLQTQITSNDSDISTLTSNLVATGSVVDDISGNLITTGQTLQTQITSNDSDISTLTSNLVTTGQTLTTNVNTVASNLVSTGTVVDDISGNLITTGQTLQTQITSNDTDITNLTSNLVTTGQTLTTDINTVSSNLVSTGSVVDDISGNLITTGQTLQTQITSNDGDITSLTSNLITTGQTLQTQITSNDGDIATLDSTTVKITTNQSVAGNKIFTDTVTINNLTVTGTEVIVDVENLAVKDNIIHINSGESGAGISRISGGITIDRGTEPSANILYNDANDRFELNFPLATEGDVVASATNLITTGQTLTTSINTVSTNLVSTGSVVDDISGNLITTGQTLQTQITSNDGDISTLTSNLVTTGQTLTTNINTVSTNLVSTGAIVDDVSGNLITTGQTLQTQITSNDTDITNLSSNLVTTGQTLTTNIDTVATNLVTTGQTLTSEIITVSGLIPATVIDGGGTANKVPLWSDANTIGDSVISQSSSKIGIGINAPSHTLSVGTDLGSISSDTAVTIGSNGDSHFIMGEDANNHGKLSWDASENSWEFSLTHGGSAKYNALVIDQTGYVGIGTHSPSRRFTVEGASGDNLPVRIIGGASTTKSSLEFQDPTTTADYKVTLGSVGDNMFFQAGGSERIRILADGKVGIGTNAPSKLLDVNGTSYFRNNIYLVDGAKAVFGAGDDLQIYHDGTDSFITNSTGYLAIKNEVTNGYTYLHGDTVHLRTYTGNEPLLTAVKDGAVSLYYDNAVKLATTSTGVAVTGQLDLSSHLDMPDNAWIKLGASDDLLITHDGSSSWIIDNGAGGLVIASDSFYIKNAAYNETGLSFIENGAVTLYYDNSAKIATTSTGVTVTGALTATSATFTGVITADAGLVLNDNDKIKLGTSGDLEIYHDGSNSYIKDAGAGDLIIYANAFRLGDTNGESWMRAYLNGRVDLYYDNAIKLTTTSTGVDVTGNIDTDTLNIMTGGHIKFDFNGVNTHFTSQSSPYIFAGQGPSGNYLAGTLNLQSRSSGVDRNINFITGTTPAIRMAVTVTGVEVTGALTATTAAFSGTLTVSGLAKHSASVATNTTFYRDSSNDWSILLSSGAFKLQDNNAAGTDRFSISSAGAATFSGSLKATTILDTNNSAGTNGQVLVSTGAALDWKTLSEISGVDGTGTAGYLSKWTDGDTIGNSVIVESSSNIGIGTATPANAVLVANHAGTSTPTNNIELMGSSLVTNGGTAIFFKASSNTTLNRYGARIHSIRTTANNGATDLVFSNENAGATALDETMRITADGNVGIGTTAPTNILDIRKATGSTYSRIGAGDASNVGHILGNSNALWYAYVVGGGNYQIWENSGANFNITPAGLVGIGTGAPGTALDIYGTDFNSSSLRLTRTGDGQDDDAAIRFDRNGTVGNGERLGGIYFNEGGTARARIRGEKFNTATGEINFQVSSSTKAITNSSADDMVLNHVGLGIGTNDPLAKLHIKGTTATNEASHILFENTQGAKKFAIGGGGSGVTNNGLGFRNVTDNTLPMIIDDAGKVGIGTTAPGYTLEVAASSATWLSRIYNTHGGAGNGLLVRVDSTSSDAILSAYSAGTHRFVVKGDGKVGIGTYSPVQQLHVVGDAMRFERTNNAVALQLYNNNASPADDAALGYLQFMGKDNDGTASIVHSEVRGGVQSNTNSAVSGYLSFLTTNNGTAVTEAMRIKSDGKVGIGTTAPARLLHVNGANDVARFQGAGSNYIDIDGAGTQLSCTTNLSFRAAVSGSAMMTIKTDGKVGIGTAAPGAKLDVAGVSRIQSTGPTLRLYDTDHDTHSLQMDLSGGNFRFYKYTGSTDASHSEIFRVTTAGVVRFNNVYSFPSVDGTAGYHLQTDGSGNVTWAAAGSGGGGTVTGTGTDNYVPRWNGTTALQNSALFSDDNGNVGIGQVAPRNPLEVDLNQSNGTLVGDSAVHFGGPHHTTGQIMGITLGYRDNSDSYRKVGIVAAGLSDSEANQDFHILVNTANSTASCSLADKKLSIYGTTGIIRVHNKFGIGGDPGTHHLYAAGTASITGSVGIGTTAPSRLLDVKSTTDDTAWIRASYSSTICEIGAHSWAAYLQSGSGDDIRIAPAGGTKMILKVDGKIGMGTLTPDHQLDLTETDAAVNLRAIIQHTGSNQAGIDFKNSAQHIRLITDGTYPFRIYDQGDSIDRLRLDTNGNFSIGDRDPVSLAGVTRFLYISHADHAGIVLDDTGSTSWETYNSGGNLWFWNEATSTNAVVFKSDGNVGIGTTAPGAKLHVYGGNIRISSTDDKPQLEFFETAAARWVIGHSTAPNNYFAISEGSDVAASERLVIAPTTGSVGIGTDVPDEKLEVYDGYLKITDAVPTMVFERQSDALKGYLTANVGYFQFSYNTKDGDGYIKMDVNSSGGSAITHEGNGYLRLGANSVSNQLVLAANGNVGIGQASPAAKLDVLGATGTVLRLDNEATAHAQNPHIELRAGPGGSVYGDNWIRFVDYSENKSWALGQDDDENIFSLTYKADKTAAPTSSPYLAIKEDGKVGIGTNAPAANLHVYRHSTSFVKIQNTSEFIGNTSGNAFRFYNYDTGGSSLWVSDGSTTSLIVKGGTGGSVGIGTAAPDQLLHIYKATAGSVTASSDAQLVVENSAIAAINLLSGSSSHGQILFGDAANNDDGQFGYDQANQEFYWKTAGSGNKALYVHANDNVTMLYGNLGIGSTAPAAPLDVARASDYKVTKFGGDVTSHYVMTGNADHTLTLTCGSYFQAEIVITANQTASGTYNNLYIRGIWSNNYTSHHWDEIENIGSLSGSTFTITNGQNGATTESGEWKIVHDYVSGTFAGMTVRITDFYGTHAYTIS